MIKDIQDYLETILDNITFGQLQDTPDDLVNINLYDTGSNPFFKDDKTHVFIMNVVIRSLSYENMLEKVEVVSDVLCNVYNTSTTQCHIIDTKKTNSDEPSRDEKNRYNTFLTYEMMVERKGE